MAVFFSLENYVLQVDLLLTEGEEFIIVWEDICVYSGLLKITINIMLKCGNCRNTLFL